MLAAEPVAWRDALRRLIESTDEALARVGRLPPDERDQVLADFRAERERLVSALSRITDGDDPWLRTADPSVSLGASADGDGARRGGRAAPSSEGAELSGVAALQASWTAGRVVAWVAGPGATPLRVSEVREALAKAGAPSAAWGPHARVPLPDGSRADAVAAPVGDVLGWLVGAAVDADNASLGPSVRWLGTVAAWAVELVAHGRMVPTLRRVKRGNRDQDEGLVGFSVRWAPALVDEARLARLAAAMPGSVTALQQEADPGGVTQTVLGSMVDAICRQAAARLEMPAAPPKPRTGAEVAEAMLSNLGGDRFPAAAQAGAELSNRLDRWARPVAGPMATRLVVTLDAPDRGGAWHLAVFAAGAGHDLEPVEVAMVTSAPTQRRQVEAHLVRLERLVPALLRPGGHRRGEVVLDQDEAWELMTGTGRSLEAAGFEVRVPDLSLRKPTPALRLVADSSTPSVVGLQQLAQVRWSVTFDDVELDAAEIARLAAQARPLVRSRGRWVALDHADLAAAAAALAERRNKTQLSGAEMLRHALGLEGSPFGGGVSLDGNSWAADLLRRAGSVSGEPAAEPDGFRGKLRSYQGEALAWLQFLDGAGLGGCLALDMGLGKTPTVLAHLLATAGSEPALVIAPPAVVGNWAAEAARFTPGLRVVVHHGAGRADADELADEVAKADVVLTTYGTAVRDVDALAGVTWGRLVVDEAQAIKNPASETAQQLRRISARTKIALTGTPIENGLGDLWSILDFANPGLVGPRPQFISQLSRGEGDAQANAEAALRALNGLLVFRRTKAEPAIAAELPDRIDELDHCAMTSEQVGLYQAVLDELLAQAAGDLEKRKGEVLAAITKLKQICNHPAAFQRDDGPLDGRSGKLARLEEIVEAVFAAGERILIFTHFAEWGERLASHLTVRTGTPVACYHGGLARTARDRIVEEFQHGTGPGALVLSLKAGGTGLNLTAASHVVLYDRWWNPAVEDQARDRAWRIGQTRTVVCHRLVCPGTVDERVEEVVAGKRRIAELVLPKSSSLGDLDAEQLRIALGIRPDQLLAEEVDSTEESAA